ncbi:peroxisomal assembly protein [Arachnomyces sp. PD_36]|nr:peroxisomal assembly protein [Arachnomyces sp. PD_36]
MEAAPHTIDHPKRRRRKGGAGKRNRKNLRSKSPLSARLVLDHHLRGDLGVLSDDLVTDLFPGLDYLEKEESVLHVAISPSSPHTSNIDDLPWTIIPVRVQSTERSQSAPVAQSTVQFPASATSLQSFAKSLQALDPTRNSIQSQRAIEIRILDVNPLNLDTLYVTVERHLLRNLDETQSKFGGGFGSEPAVNGLWSKGRGGSMPDLLSKKGAKKTAMDAEGRLTAAVREALSTWRVVHTGDVIPLPLPSHPITHVPPPPARISFCEPVSQGLLMPKTKIIIVQAKPQQTREASGLQQPGRGLLKDVAEDEADDTSNEQFYSAAEDKPIESSTDLESTSPADDSETDASIQSGNEASDDSLDDMISLAAPELPSQPSGTMSAVTSATPRPGGRRPDGVATPGSVLSGFTSGTTRPGRTSGKVFKAEGLLNRVPSEALHPKPREDDDVDSFIFVDINALVKIGCFSGDWVRIEAAEEPQMNIFSSLKFGGLDGLKDPDEEDTNWRAVKVYGVPGLSSSKPRYPVNKSSSRRPSASQLPGQKLTLPVLVPPVLLSNLDAPKYLKLSPLSPHHHGNNRPGLSQNKLSSAKSPPVAKEVTLLKISTPLSMDRTLQPALFAGLKRYFESKRRLLKSGDLVGISVDEGLGKAIFSATKSADGGMQDEDLTNKLGFSTDAGPSGNYGFSKVGVAWFRVGQIVSGSNGESEDGADGDRWGGVAVIDSMSTRMVQAGSEISTVPGTLGNNWEYWLGVKALPQMPNHLPNPSGLITELPKSFVPPLQTRLRDLMSVATSPRAIQLGMKPVVALLTSTQRNIGKATLASRACADIGLHPFTIDAYDILTEGGANGGDVKTEAYLKARADRAFSCGSNCTALIIQHIEVLTADRMVSTLKEIVADSRVIVATTTDIDKIPEGIRSLFSHEMEMTAPEEKEREGILRNVVSERSVKISADVDLASVAVKTAALVAGDLVDVVERAVAAKNFRLEKLAETASNSHNGSQVTVTDIQLSGGDAGRCVIKSDFDAAVDAARKNFADSIGAPKIPNVSWDDVGGLSNVKDAVVETIQLPLERPELFAKGMKKRSGILFYGPPGTGKTLLAKAIATEFSLNFFSVKGPELLNMYIGESEANVRRVFQRARDARPCVVFFDELDSVAPKRGNQGDSGGVMDRIVSQLLAELDGMSNGDDTGGGVFVIGATNRPDLLDQALLRPGRFDKMLYLGVSDTHHKQLTILEALTRKFNMDPELSLHKVVEQLPFTYTGADMYALCSDAMLKAVTRKASRVDDMIQALPNGPVSTAYFFDHLATPEDVAVMVTEQDFIDAKNELVGSVSAKELEHFERVRKTFESTDKKDSAETSTSNNAGETARQQSSQTIGDVVNGIKAGVPYVDPDFEPDGLPVNTATASPTTDSPPSSNNTQQQHANKHRYSALRKAGGKAVASMERAIGGGSSGSGSRMRGSSGKGKGKGKDKDKSVSTDRSRNGENGHHHASSGSVFEDAKEDGVEDGSGDVDGEDDDEDEYIVKTDHLAGTMGR